VKSLESVKLLTVRNTAFEPAAAGAGSANTEAGDALPPYLPVRSVIVDVQDACLFLRNHAALLR